MQIRWALTARDIDWDESNHRISSITLPGIDHFMVARFPEELGVPVAMCLAGSLEEFAAPFEVHATILDPDMQEIADAAARVEPLGPGVLIDERMLPAKTYAFGPRFTAEKPGLHTIRWDVRPGGAHAEVSVLVSLTGTGPAIE
jgi:hypothetical protein